VDNMRIPSDHILFSCQSLNCLPELRHVMKNSHPCMNRNVRPQSESLFCDKMNCMSFEVPHMSAVLRGRLRGRNKAECCLFVCVFGRIWQQRIAGMKYQRPVWNEVFLAVKGRYKAQVPFTHL